MDELCKRCSLMKQNSGPKKFKMLELYSGIGGMHFALKETGLPIQSISVTALEVNTVANRVYANNFGEDPCVQLQSRNICSLTVEELTRMQLDLLTASPPCQPFTRQGKQLDDQDARTDSFLHVLENVLPNLPNPPPTILIENVKGFELSKTRHLLVQTLRKRNYQIAEFLLQPCQFGVPNSRLRYYCLARLDPSGFCFDLQSMLKDMTEADAEQGILREYPKYLSAKTCSSCVKQFFGLSRERLSDGRHSIVHDSVCSLKNYLQNLSTEQQDQVKIPDSILLRYHAVFDIVDEESRQSCCFTKGYGNLIKGAGSYLSQNSSVDEVYEQVEEIKRLPDHIKSEEEKNLEILNNLKKLRLRYFTPDEVANLLFFPSGKLQFPSDCSNRSKYRLLGNSINVRVVTWLMRLLLCNQIGQ